ncbi:hypothetical protein EV182_007049 [Spiromyces aspiralis]|uniref:Uncharacterized protein n=1 Tax=Spiromyces aspiralis TaxID=68401 RepID=A0ACC1HEX3_9FUNG|nr:hypothetical protein EV182_007049 [Spiromyces aspiralis]
MPFLGRLLGVLRKTGSQWLKRLPKWVRNKQAEVNQRRLISYIKSVMALFTISLLISFDSPARTFGMPFILSFLVVSALHPGRTMGAHIELSFVMALVTGITTAYLVIVQLIVFSISSNTSYAYPSGARIFRAVALAVGCFFLSTARAYWSRYQGIFNLQAFLVFQVLTIFDDTRNFTLNGIPKTVASMMLGTGITMFWNFAVPDTASHILE